MANIPSQIKRNRQNEKRRLRNRDFRGAARSAVKVALTAIDGGQDAQAAVTRALSLLDRAARKGAIHHRNAARRKGRLIKRFSALGQRPAATIDTPAAETARVSASTPAKQATAVAEAKPKAAPKKAAAKTSAKKTPAKKTTKK